MLIIITKFFKHVKNFHNNVWNRYDQATAKPLIPRRLR